MFDTATLFWGLIFGALGTGYFTHGKRQQALVPMLSGLGLFIVPYLTTNPWILVPAGLLLCLLPRLLG